MQKIEFSDMVNSFQAGVFAMLNEKKEELLKQGRTVYNLSVGTPDFPPAPHIMKAMQEACEDPENYRYCAGRSAGTDGGSAVPLSEKVWRGIEVQ